MRSRRPPASPRGCVPSPAALTPRMPRPPPGARRSGTSSGARPRRSAHAARAVCRDGHALRRRAVRPRRPREPLHAAAAHPAGVPLRRLADPHDRLAGTPQPKRRDEQPHHPRHDRRARLQPGGDHRPAGPSRGRPRGLLRGRQLHPHRHPARPARRGPRPRRHRRRHPRARRPRPGHRAGDPRRAGKRDRCRPGAGRRPAAGAAGREGPGSTARSPTAPRRSTSRWSPERACRSPSKRETPSSARPSTPPARSRCAPPTSAPTPRWRRSSAWSRRRRAAKRRSSASPTSSRPTSCLRSSSSRSPRSCSGSSSARR